MPSRFSNPSGSSELVSQSLDIVPDASRARLRIDHDESLSRLGTIRVVRTVLRLVLQNVIINASEAVRDAGKDSGMLRFWAEVTRDAGHDQLHLHAQDDGVGIRAENIDRIFQKGYTTKSRGTNHGIGLHWCANAIRALGGRIWATSDGLGFRGRHPRHPAAGGPHGAFRTLRIREMNNG